VGALTVRRETVGGPGVIDRTRGKRKARFRYTRFRYTRFRYTRFRYTRFRYTRFRYTRFSAFLMVPRSFWIFSCSSVMA
jgi:hypothetical protein